MKTSYLRTVVAATTVFVSACSAAQMPTAPRMEALPATPTSPPVPSATSPATARYRVTFESAWSVASHPVEFPSSAHFSPLVGATHTGAARFWSEGAPASAGIKDMAERGRTSPLDHEVQAAIGAGTAERLLVGGGIGTSPGVVTLEFEISQAHPLVTLVSMIAPSPDWFVGVAALPLFENGRWIEERRIDLVPWDAGTDSGATFASPDLATLPPQTVSRIVATPLSPNGRVTPLGAFTFTRLQS